MKKIMFLMILLKSLVMFGYAQCEFKSIFPIEFGTSRFNTIIGLQGNDYFEEAKDVHYPIFNAWIKPEYLNGDSAYKSAMFYELIDHPCFNGDDNDAYIRFIDDHLYKIRILADFSSNGFNDCKRNYELLASCFKKQFDNWEDFVLNNQKTNEQLGEGIWFYPVEKEKMEKEKIHLLSLQYSIQFSYDSHEIQGYRIEINYANLKGTKLTIEGY